MSLPNLPNSYVIIDFESSEIISWIFTGGDDEDTKELLKEVKENHPDRPDLVLYRRVDE